MDRGPHRGPPDTARYADREGVLPDGKTSWFTCEGNNSSLYHAGQYQARSATPLSLWQFSVFNACSECCLPQAGFSHRRCCED